MRLRQTAGLLEWMVENGPDRLAAKGALEAVNTAHTLIEADAETRWAADPSIG